MGKTNQGNHKPRLGLLHHPPRCSLLRHPLHYTRIQSVIPPEAEAECIHLPAHIAIEHDVYNNIVSWKLPRVEVQPIVWNLNLVSVNNLLFEDT